MIVLLVTRQIGGAPHIMQNGIITPQHLLEGKQQSTAQSTAGILAPQCATTHNAPTAFRPRQNATCQADALKFDAYSKEGCVHVFDCMYLCSSAALWEPVLSCWLFVQLR